VIHKLDWKQSALRLASLASAVLAAIYVFVLSYHFLDKKQIIKARLLAISDIANQSTCAISPPP
jgi:hypothetical protein